jgi:hypothetical protein
VTLVKILARNLRIASFKAFSDFRTSINVLLKILKFVPKNLLKKVYNQPNIDLILTSQKREIKVACVLVKI